MSIGIDNVMTEIRKIYEEVGAKYDQIAEKSFRMKVDKMAPGEPRPENGTLFFTWDEDLFEAELQDARAEAYSIIDDCRAELRSSLTEPVDASEVAEIQLFKIRVESGEGGLELRKDIDSIVGRYGENLQSYKTIKAIVNSVSDQTGIHFEYSHSAERAESILKNAETFVNRYFVRSVIMHNHGIDTTAFDFTEWFNQSGVKH